MTLLPLVRTSSGNTIRLATVLGKGGEGTVYGVDDDPRTVVKIYAAGKAGDRAAKVSHMVAAAFFRTTTFVAFPIELVAGPRGEIIGFTMRRIADARPIHELYAPGSRKAHFPEADFRFLSRAATNLARAVASIHRTGCVIGDINHSGILVAKDATLALIDSDSFQVKTDTRLFRCRVGVSEYTPPELQGKDFDRIERTGDHDNFGLAVLLFQLLFMGRHPFAGRFRGGGDMPIERAIRERRFAYSVHGSLTQMDPPPHVPTLADLPANIAAAFEQAFRQPSVRPTAKAWIDLLSRAEEQLVACPVDGAHHYWNSATICPWCRMETETGLNLFSPRLPTASSGFDLSQLERQLEAVPDVGEAPDLADVLKQVKPPRPSKDARAVANRLLARRIAGIGIVVAAGVLALQVWGYLVWLGVLAAPLLFGGRAPARRFRDAAKRAAAGWKPVCDDWRLKAGPARFRERKEQLRKKMGEHRGLAALERAKLADLERRKRHLQLDQFLDGHFLARARIQGIGDTRKATLASYGIESALDITDRKLKPVPGFGPSRMRVLLAWRQSIEERFVFDPGRPADPGAIRSVKDEIARARMALEKELANGPASLQAVAASILQQRRSPPHDAISAYSNLRQAKADVDATR